MPVEWLLPAGLILVLDQVSKKLVLGRLDRRLRSPAGSGPRIRPVSNASIGLGLVRNRRTIVLLWGVMVVGMVLLIHYVVPFERQIVQFGLGAAFGGATGNLLDMLRRGAVVDFIDLRIWPVFNLADAAMVLGMAAALWSLW